MEVSEQIQIFQQFIEIHYLAELLETIRKGQNFFSVDFIAMSKHSPSLADLLLEQPEEVLKACELAITNFDLPKEIKQFHIRFHNLPEQHKTYIRNIRSEHINKLLVIEGTIRQKSDVRPQVTSARFECPSCGNVMNVLQLDSKFKEPMRCGCGRKGKFRLLSKELIDVQGIVLEEVTKDLEGGAQPKRINVLLKQDLVSPMSDKKTNPGTSIQVIGLLKEVPIILRSGGQSTKYDLLVEANNIIPLEEDYSTIEITPKEEEIIRKIAQDPHVYKKLALSLAPGIYGHQKIKEALILQFVGGVKKLRDDGVMSRGDIHILLIGDPGAVKSQLLKRSAVVAPKARFVSGKGVSGAGLTAAVVKDEFLSGWSLEAGAMVLANKGILMIDEMDKMTDEDRSAMHEGMEQQSFVYDTSFQFSDGSETKIGEYVESLFKLHPEKIVQGKDCFVLKLDSYDKKMLTTDWKNIFEAPIDRISKHIAPDHFIQITAGNGRIITVTPEHPIFCIVNGRITTKAAECITSADILPVPLSLPITGKEQEFFVSQQEIYNERSTQHIICPAHNDKNFFALIGYILSEGSIEINRKKVIGINFTNSNKKLVDDFAAKMLVFFGLKPYLQKKEGYWMARYVSTELTEFLQKVAPEILEKAGNKKIPQVCMQGTQENIATMLSCMFEGDGHVSKKTRTIRIGYTTISKQMAEQIQDLLLRFKIQSNITTHKGVFKVAITGYDNLYRFNHYIRFITEKKNAIIIEYISNTNVKTIRTVKDTVPCGEILIPLLKKYGVFSVGKNTFATMKHDYITKHKSVSRKHLQKAVALLQQRAHTEDAQTIELLHQWAFGEIGSESVRSVKKVENKNQQWTYDITIEPHHTFISQNMVLHNTISISKANIQATLRCETTILAAANPKFGRFDPYEPIAKQINLPPALINRFDLIFSIKDLPDKDKDEELAHFILSLHKKHQTMEVDIQTDLLRKYLIFARQKIVPRLSEQALEELKEYYVRMRSSGFTEEKGIKAIPISARQLEALVRLAEASAKVRLSDTITRKDAKYAINLLHYCLEQVGMDPETGKIDIDRISTGITTSERTKILSVREIIHDLEEKLHTKAVPLEEILKAAQERGLNEDKVIESLDKLKRSGDLFEPRKGFISRI